ncbi:hypothetical protein BDP27DRAFT_1416504 [Rhodocollybia butyracea]|uniref:Uncharacterized protein n=1 Tax=Rhodocollybia butyracea TaxID=206335 RepID=A0A9P5UDF8_9AGAR|nr:hypothetical protein BDP27DRAFT_1416504 [Rhodocollybia butyracea]
MHYPLLFMVIASSLLAVHSQPMEAHPLSEISAAAEPSTQVPTMTFVDGRTGKDVESNLPLEHHRSHYATSIAMPINGALGRRPYDKIMFKNLYNPLPESEMSYIKVAGVLGCTEANPCPGWMAKGLRPTTGTWYVCIITGKPGLHQFSGRPVTKTSRKERTTHMMQNEWDRLSKEYKDTFNTRLSNEPEVPTVTFIDGTTGDDFKGGPYHKSEPPGTHYTKSIAMPINGALDRGLYKTIWFKNLYNPLPESEMSYIKVAGVLGCTEANPCPGWMAQGLRPKTRTWYVGIITGKPGLHRFSGRPVTKTSRKEVTTIMMQKEWNRLSNVYKNTFLVPEVTFATPVPSGHPYRPKDFTKALNGALNRDSKDPIIYKGQHAKVPEPPVDALNSPPWFHFKLIRGDKRCAVKTPCFGCIVVELGTIHVFIAQKGTHPGQLERIGVYPGPEENDLFAGLTLEVMEKQVEYWSSGSRGR